MPESYFYDVQTDFTGLTNPGIANMTSLNSEIMDCNITSASFIGINAVDNNVETIFDEVLSQADNDTLDTIVANHTGDAVDVPTDVPTDVSPSDITVATAEFTTTSTSDVLVDSMSLTPAAGNYLVWFSGTISHVSNQSIVYISIYVDGVKDTGSERKYERGNMSGGFAKSFCSVAKVTVNGSQAIEGRWRTSTATAKIFERSLAILKVI